MQIIANGVKSSNIHNSLCHFCFHPAHHKGHAYNTTRFIFMEVKTLHTLFVGQTVGQTGGRRARSTIHTILIARYVEIATAVCINGSPGNLMSPSTSRASTNIYYHLVKQKRVQLVISLYILMFIRIKSHVVFLTLFMLCTRYLA
jgi:hypothetical protein